MDSVLGNQPKEYTFNGKTILIKKLTFRQYIKLGECLEKVVQNKGLMDKFSTGIPVDFIQGVIGTLQFAPDVISDVLTITTGLSKDEVLDAIPDEVTALLIEVWKMNDLIDLVKKNLDFIAPKEKPAIELTGQ